MSGSRLPITASAARRPDRIALLIGMLHVVATHEQPEAGGHGMPPGPEERRGLRKLRPSHAVDPEQPPGADGLRARITGTDQTATAVAVNLEDYLPTDALLSLAQEGGGDDSGRFRHGTTRPQPRSR